MRSEINVGIIIITLIQIVLIRLGDLVTCTAITYGNMASVYNKQDEYEKAFEWYERGLAIQLKTLGPEHPYVTSTQWKIASMQ